MNSISRMLLFFVLMGSVPLMSMQHSKEKDVTAPTSQNPASVAQKDVTTVKPDASVFDDSKDGRWNLPGIPTQRTKALVIIGASAAVLAGVAAFSLKRWSAYLKSRFTTDADPEDYKKWPAKLDDFINELVAQQTDKNQARVLLESDEQNQDEDDDWEKDVHAIDWEQYRELAASDPHEVLDKQEFVSRLDSHHCLLWLGIMQDWCQDYFLTELSKIITNEEQKHLLEVAKEKPSELLSAPYVQDLYEEQKIAMANLYKQMNVYAEKREKFVKFMKRIQRREQTGFDVCEQSDTEESLSM